MNRRKLLKAITLGAFAPNIVLEAKTKAAQNNLSQLSSPEPEMEAGKSELISKPYRSDWQNMPDRIWTGEELWAQRLQDWGIQKGELACLLSGPNRTVHLLTHQLIEKQAAFTTNVNLKILNTAHPKKGHFVGFKVGIKGNFPDYRSAIITGKGLNVGVNTDGSLFIGQAVSTGVVSLPNLQEGIFLKLTATPAGNQFILELTASGNNGKKQLVTIKNENIPADSLVGNIALISHFELETPVDTPSASFNNWQVTGDKLAYAPQQVYGPIYFAQYTVNHNILKLSAQLAPVNLTSQKKASLEVKRDDNWEKIAEVIIHPKARVAAFRVENWQTQRAVPYRVRYDLSSRNGKAMPCYYEGTIAAEPTQKDQVKALTFSCNGDLGFPDTDIVENAQKHQADLILFLGDQFYERNGDFGIQTAPLDKAILDYLRKWVQFGWSYRELFRHIPSACLPDDHDMYHGNIWGSGGRAAINAATKNDRQDSGGYQMPPEWVNLAQLCQTSHMPDPFDATPVLQNISVYYTHWQYGGISFGIIEDRKFKSAPKEILPAMANVRNGYAQNQTFDIQQFKEPATVQLLGDRQLAFLKSWTQDWSKNTQFKVLVSATPFMCLQTLPKGTLNDSVTGKLEIPEPGQYIAGDFPTRDMDTDGWPHNRRDEVVKLLRQSYTFHIAGDQHLPSVVQYGEDNHGDSGFVFAAPALGNIFPRRWWPPVSADHQHLPGQPAYTGNFTDGFNNKITVHAVANPHKTNKEPAIVYDRVTGYGVVTFNKQNRDIVVECWPRFVDPLQNPKGQYLGWPVTIQQQQNYNRKETGFLPLLKIEGLTNPVLEIIHEKTNTPEYTIRLNTSTFKPKVFGEGPYTIVVSDPDLQKKKVLKGIVVKNTQEPIVITV
ncbi:alkaline phosphatase D family protein [Adhaeribacter pallidiroseus]|uniref:Alkaline phosphatase n=1 Tax=Adhaeribacter pallidiroseus TaxID=2072847 RepID=A0A369QEM8_9BACT|nr:alkaline phosphatase D family protein [Adhaeribacter pallidiroseus]RDC61697.1 Alkaline phosphatase [Adhaeribacter pallidiroseus]